MKKTILSLLGVFLFSALFAQTKPTAKPAAKPAAKPGTTTTQAATSAPKNAVDSFSYAIAMSTAKYFKNAGIKEVNNTMIINAFNDVFKKDKTLLTDEQVNSVITTELQRLQSQQYTDNLKKGQDFLNANKTKEGVVTLPSGLQYRILREGTGPKPALNDKVKVHYHGTLIDGTVFDSSVDRGEPIVFPVSGVIQGWIEAIQLMPVGSKWRLFIPSDLAYGDRGAGPTIKPGSALIFDVELLGIEPKEPQQ